MMRAHGNDKIPAIRQNQGIFSYLCFSEESFIHQGNTYTA